MVFSAHYHLQIDGDTPGGLTHPCCRDLPKLRDLPAQGKEPDVELRAGGQHFGAVHHALGPLCLLHTDSLPGAQFVQLLSPVRAQTSLRFDQAPLFPLPNRTENGIYGSSVEPPSCPEGGQQISRLQLLRAPSSDRQPVSLNPSLLPTRGRQQGPIPAF